MLKRGPADQRGLNLKAGRVSSLAIDGVEMTEQTDLSKLLNGKAGETVSLQVAANPDADPQDPRRRRRVESRRPSAADAGRPALMYDRWVENNARRVAELSKGKLGYIHIPSMDEDGLDRFVRSLYSDNFDKEAIVLDVRFNGGGFTHDQVLNYLGGQRAHASSASATAARALVLRSHDRKWTKPLVLLINNRSYSDAEIFPSAFRTLGLGKLVGQPTGGYVIGTGERPADRRLAVPHPAHRRLHDQGREHGEGRRACRTCWSSRTPTSWPRGMDAQLDKAVEVLQHDVAEWKKSHPSAVAVGPEPMKPATPVAVCAGGAGFGDAAAVHAVGEVKIVARGAEPAGRRGAGAVERPEATGVLEDLATDGAGRAVRQEAKAALACLAPKQAAP